MPSSPPNAPPIVSPMECREVTAAKKPSSMDFGWCFIGADGWMFGETHHLLDPQGCRDSAELQEHIVTEGGRVAPVKLVERI